MGKYLFRIIKTNKKQNSQEKKTSLNFHISVGGDAFHFLTWIFFVSHPLRNSQGDDQGISFTNK